jgi:glycosyltransferase involved in cell wall biosynthesis
VEIFVIIESFLPGDKGGGPVRALDNLLGHLVEAHTFKVFTRNHDYLTAQAYPHVAPNQWIDRAGASVFYATDATAQKDLIRAILTEAPDWIYLNGAFPPLTRFYLLQRQQNPELAKIPVLLAPHGNFGPASLQYHRWRKQAWLAYAKARGLYQDLRWHAASEREAEQIRAIFGRHAEIRIVSMAPRRKAPSARAPAASCCDASTSNPATSSTLHLIYFGRLSPEKNLPFAFKLLSRFADENPGVQVSYDLIGSGEPRHEAKLRRLSDRLPSAIQVNFIGHLSAEALQSRLHCGTISHLRQGFGAQAGKPPSSSITHHSSPPYTALLMPSLTENFSYTVLESLQAGIPVLISDQTPWRDLQGEGIGWDLPLAEPEPWLQALAQLLRPEIQQRLRSQAVAFAEAWTADYPEQAKQLFSS